MRRALLVMIPFLLFALVAVPTGTTQDKKADELQQLIEQAKKLQAEIDDRTAKGEAKKPGPKPPAPKVEEKYGRGRVEPPKAKLAAAHAASAQRNGQRVAMLPKATPATFDCREFGWVPPIKNQSNCGSCYWFSANGVCEMAFIKAGYAKNDGSFGLSEQFGLDCEGGFGGCGGGWEAEVVAYCKSKGIPAVGDYGPYNAREGACRLKQGTKRWQIEDWGYCTPDQSEGVAATQHIKNAMVQYGPISVAVSADNWDSYAGGVFKGNSRNVNHAVVLTGWDDTKGTKGVWILRNSWGTGWGNEGYMEIEFGANSVGTEALWASATMLPPPPPPDPPTPPDPPVPPLPPTPGGYAQIVLDSHLPPGTYTLMPKAVLDRLRVLDAERQLLLNPKK